MSYTVEVIETKLFSSTVAEEIVVCLSESTDKNPSVLLSGGSTPGEVYRQLSMPPKVTEVDWKRVNFFFGDERWVPHSDSQSNSKMAHETLFSKLSESPNVYSVDTSLSSPKDGASKYESKIKEIVGSPPHFSLVLLGIGEDGHTASLFPGSPALNERSKYVCSCSHPSGGPERITITPSVVTEASRVLFIIKGSSKADIVKRVIEGDDLPSVLPARIFLEAKGSVTFFLDSESASRLSHHA